MINTLADTHAHVFRRDLPMLPSRRYTPDYDADSATYLNMLDRNSIGFGVLVQPSFYGTDNSYMLSALERAPDRLCGIAVVEQDIKDAELELLVLQGIVGIRFNLIGDNPWKLREPGWRSLVRRISELGWQVEIQAEGNDIPDILRYLSFTDTPLVFDHFGKPNPDLGLGCRGFQALLDQGPGGNVYVKLSASYRCGGRDTSAYADALFEYLGPDRLLWGSDWPWTQFETERRYQDLPGYRKNPNGGTPWAEMLAATALKLYFPVIQEREARAPGRMLAVA